MITQNNDIRPDFRVGFSAEDLLYSFLDSFSLMPITKPNGKLFDQWQRGIGEKGAFFWATVSRGRARFI
ncbi:hypothetical protein ORI89_01890 [Sphingobacterium sp. UT-1RO-CII-1]|uniref:hypothetical protein n=1 Tax=Sphingobacterium sp. UT-1RO-CII-1 TaxID=2995225 RepID=UPI00227BCB40|nr:hypothetical protein [Sphingobacterium sp. UT-1RO-CII-1]MCY4778385.1 hypothetical protein [Sphingobacterium sp. UT-1RO-CII-1]